MESSTGCAILAIRELAVYPWCSACQHPSSGALGEQTVSATQNQRSGKGFGCGWNFLLPSCTWTSTSASGTIPATTHLRELILSRVRLRGGCLTWRVKMKLLELSPVAAVLERLGCEASAVSVYYSTGNRYPHQQMFWPLIIFRCNLLPNTKTMSNQLINSGVTTIGCKRKQKKRYGVCCGQ